MSNASDSRFTRRCVVRFTVGEPKGSQSSVWRLWTHGNDVYISLRDLTKVKKVSLHPSGRWRNAWAEEHVAKGSPFVAPGQDRATDKWERPPELAPGVTRAFDIVVPASEVTQPQHLDPNSLNGKKIMWVPPLLRVTLRTSRLYSPRRRLPLLPYQGGPDATTEPNWSGE